MAIIQKPWGRRKPPLGAQLNRGHPLSRGLVAYWVMNEGGGATAYDVSGYRNSGVLTNGPTWGLGKYGRGITFDGSDDYINLGNPAFANFGAGDFTMFARINNTAQTTLDAIFCKDQNGANLRQFYFILNGDWTGAVSAGRLSAMVFSSHLNGYGVDSDAGVVSANAWHDVAYRSLGGAQTLWLDGQSLNVTARSIGVGAAGITMANTAVQLDIGRREYALFTNEFIGSFDEVRIYNRALTAKEIADLYVQPFADFVPMSTPVGRLAAAGGARPRLIDGRLVNHGLLIGGLAA